MKRGLRWPASLTACSGSYPTYANTVCDTSMVRTLENSDIREAAYAIIKVLDSHVSDDPMLSVSSLPKEGEAHLISNESCKL